MLASQRPLFHKFFYPMVDFSKITVLNQKSIKVIPESAGLYPADDLPPYIEKLARRLEKKKRERRTDLVKGNVVVVLEGEFASRRVIFLQQIDGNKALCCGPKSINSVPFFSIDERYLLKTSTIIPFRESVNVSLDNVLESKRGLVSETMDIELTSEEKKIDSAIAKEVEKIRFMKRYLATPFKMPSFKGVSSLSF